MSTLKARAKGNVFFQYYQDDNLYYSCEDGFIFPVPISDCKGARFRVEEKGLLFLRWIGRYMKDIAVFDLQGEDIEENEKGPPCGAV